MRKLLKMLPERRSSRSREKKRGKMLNAPPKTLRRRRKKLKSVWLKRNAVRMKRHKRQRKRRKKRRKRLPEIKQDSCRRLKTLKRNANASPP